MNDICTLYGYMFMNLLTSSLEHLITLPRVSSANICHTTSGSQRRVFVEWMPFLLRHICVKHG